jgi:hypothetical protein
MTVSTLAILLRAANKPRAEKLEKATELWTNGSNVPTFRASGVFS